VIGPIPSVIIEILFSELYRDPKKTEFPFRLTGNKDYKEAVQFDIAKAIHSRANIYRSISHGYAKKGIVDSIISKNKTQTRDALIDSVNKE